MPTEITPGQLEVRCDRCGRKFRAGISERTVPGEGAVQEMECPHCHHVYPVARITPKGLTLRDRLKITSDPEERQKLVAMLKEEVSRG